MKVIPDEEKSNSLCNFATMWNAGINSARSNYITTDKPFDKYRRWDLDKLDSNVSSSLAVPDMALWHQRSQRSVGIAQHICCLNHLVILSYSGVTDTSLAEGENIGL